MRFNPGSESRETFGGLPRFHRFGYCLPNREIYQNPRLTPESASLFTTQEVLIGRELSIIRYHIPYNPSSLFTVDEQVLYYLLDQSLHVEEGEERSVVLDGEDASVIFPFIRRAATHSDRREKEDGGDGVMDRRRMAKSRRKE